MVSSWLLLGRPAVNASESNCPHHLEAKLGLFWAEDWPALWATVTLLLFTAQHTGQQQNKNSHASVRQPRWLDLVNEDEPWQQPGMHRQSQSRSKLSKRSRVSVLQIPILPLLPKHLWRTFSCRKLPNLFLPHFVECHDPANLDRSAGALSTGMTLESKPETAVLHSVLQYFKDGQITHAARQTHWRTQTAPHDVIFPQACSQISHGSKKESVAKCAGHLQFGVGPPDGANTMNKTVQYLAEADSSQVLVALDL